MFMTAPKNLVMGVYFNPCACDYTVLEANVPNPLRCADRPCGRSLNCSLL
jgi:hypothetical protein